MSELVSNASQPHVLRMPTVTVVCLPLTFEGHITLTLCVFTRQAEKERREDQFVLCGGHLMKLETLLAEFVPNEGPKGPSQGYVWLF